MRPGMKKLTSLVVATHNVHKLEEIAAWFGPYGVEIVPLSLFPRKCLPRRAQPLLKMR